MTITETTTVGEIAAALPASVRVLQRRRVDFCCGGKRPIGEVCREQGLQFSELVREIEAIPTPSTSADRDWNTESLDALIDHIVAVHHDSLRQELPRLEAMALKAERAHRSKAPYLTRVADLVRQLSVDLHDHMRKEEQVLFPSIRRLANGERQYARWIAAPIAVMEQEHDGAGKVLAELRGTTDEYTPPEWACATVRALYQGLDELEGGMHLHVHLENNVLFPRAITLAERAD